MTVPEELILLIYAINNMFLEILFSILAFILSLDSNYYFNLNWSFVILYTIFIYFLMFKYAYLW